METISLPTARAASATGCLEALTRRREQFGPRIEVLRVSGRLHRVAPFGNAVKVGLVESPVDEIRKLRTAGGNIVMKGATLEEPIRHISEKMPLFPGQNDFAFWPGMNKTDTVTTEKPVLMDAIRQGRMIENLLLYRQTFVIRSYEVGADRCASIETLMNLFQETALNHVRLSGIGGDGFGTTKAMAVNGLIWVVSRMHVEVDRYPAWGEVVEMDSWVASLGKLGMRRDWLLRNVKTGQVLARATSTWVMMHEKTRRLSKMPVDVRKEISPYFLERHAIQDEISLKINKLQDESALYRISNLQARRKDLDMNQHVNNVKYIGWMMESVPRQCLEKLEIKSITLEYRRECGQTDVVDSLTNPEKLPPVASGRGQPCVQGTRVGEVVADHEFPYVSESKLGKLLSAESQRNLRSEPEQFAQFIHLLKMQRDGAEIVRGRTIWKSEPLSSQYGATHN